MNPIISAAREVALLKHHTQFYPPQHGPISFGMHLGHAVSVLHRYSIEDPVIHAATWLHDILEDTPTTAEDLDRLLMEHQPDHAHQQWYVTVGEVLDVVKAVTDAPGKNRTERKLATYPKIRAVGPRAVVVKLADRIANVEASLLGGRGHDYLAIYKKEWDGFRASLGVVSGVPVVLWNYLDRLLGAEHHTRPCLDTDHLPGNA